MEDFEDLAIHLRAEVAKLAKRAATTVLPLWVIIITVIVGTGLLALFLGFFCLFVCRRRRSSKSGRIVLLNGISAPASDGGSSNDERERGRGKLRKRQRYAGGGGGGSGEEDDIDDVEGEIGFREISPVRKVSMLVMPDIFLRRGSLNPFAGAGAGGGGGSVGSSNTRYGNGGSNGHGHRRIMSNAWIDEDTLHGPKMTSALADQAINKKAKKKSWRRSIRESWPLKTLSPTLPKLAPFDAGQEGADEGMHDSMTMLYFGNHSDRILPELPPPPGLVTRGYDGQGSPPRPLPKPHRKALLATNGNHAVGDAVPRTRGLSYYRYEGTDEPVKSTNSLRVKPGGGVGVESGAAIPRGGHLSSAGSTLSVILKDTEMRLQEVARRNRSSASPPKSTPVGQDVSAVTLVDSGPRTPSPTKSDKPSPVSAEAASAHARQTSDASVLSEADSMVGDPSPAPQYHGLTSPSRSKPQQQKQSPHRKKLSRTASLTSSVDSSLSDISEEKSMVSGTTPNTTAPNSSKPADMNKLADFVSGDPFTATNDSTTPSSNKAGPSSRGVYAASRGGHGALDQQRGRHTSEETLFAISQSPLSLISGNSRSPDPSPTRVADRANKTKTPQPAVIHFPVPPSRNNLSDEIHKKAPAGQSEPASVAMPSLSLVDPSVEGDSPTPKRTGVVGRLDHTPTLVHGSQPQDRERSPEIVPPSPALSSVYDCYAALHSPNPASSSPFTVTPTTRRRAAGEVRNISDETSSSYYSEQACAYEKQKAAALNELNVLLKQETTAGTTTTGSKSIQVQTWGTVRLVPPEQQVYGGRTLKVSATVAELRRMNSQVSAHSVTASGYSDDSAVATPRPEVVSPPRKGAAARNYLALGSLLETSPRSGARAGHHEKENDRAGGRKARVEVDENVRLRPGGGPVAVAVTPTRNRWNGRKAQVMEEGGRRSEESLGLYDEDGFLISPERRSGLRT